MQNASARQTRWHRLLPAVGLLLVAQSTYAQLIPGCTVGVNTPGPQYHPNYPYQYHEAAWGQYGTQFYMFGWLPITSVYYRICTGFSCGFLVEAEFSPAMNSAVRAAIANWHNARQANNSQLPWVEEFNPPLSTDVYHVNLSLISGAAIEGNAGETTITFGHYEGDGNPNNGAEWYRIIAARTVLHKDINVASYMTFVVAHELGHTMALADCYSCTINTTVMSSEQYFLNDTSAVPLGPTPCDNSQSHQTAWQ